MACRFLRAADVGVGVVEAVVTDVPAGHIGRHEAVADAGAAGAADGDADVP